MLARVIDGGIEFGVRVSPGSRRSRIVGFYGDRLKVRVAAAPQAGKANRELCRLLAEELGVPAGDVAIVRGDTSPDKVVRVRGALPQALARFETPATVHPP